LRALARVRAREGRGTMSLTSLPHQDCQRRTLHPDDRADGANLARGWREALREANSDRIGIPMRVWLLASTLTTRAVRHRVR
jgi:hypothetical protein